MTDVCVAGVSKSKSVSVVLDPGSRQLRAELVMSSTGLPDLSCSLQLPATVWLVAATADTETFAELLLSGSLAFMQAKQITREVEHFPEIISRLVTKVNLTIVERQENTASLYAESSDRSRLAFLVKQVSTGLSLEARGEDKDLLGGVVEEVASLMMST